MNGTEPSIHESLDRDPAAARERLFLTLWDERTLHESGDYLSCRDVQVTESDRATIVGWCHSVVDACRFDREVVASAMGMVDRFLSRPSPVADAALRDRARYQLVAVAALSVAVKMDRQNVDGAALLAALGRGVYRAEDVARTELELLEGLAWRVCAPTSFGIARDVLLLTLPHANLRGSTWAFVLDEVRFRCEYAVRDYLLSTKRPSTVALAAIFDTLDHVDPQDRRAMCRALAMVTKRGSFDSPKDLRVASDRLKLLLLNDGVVIEYHSNDTGIEDYTVVSVSDTSRSSEDSPRSFSDIELESHNGFGDQDESHASPRSTTQS